MAIGRTGGFDITPDIGSSSAGLRIERGIVFATADNCGAAVLQTVAKLTGSSGNWTRRVIRD
jgi:hypothetical protein